MGFLGTALDPKYILILYDGQSPFTAYAKRWLPGVRDALRHLPALRAALAYLGREVRRLENQVTGTRRRRGRGR